MGRLGGVICLIGYCIGLGAGLFVGYLLWGAA